MYHHAAANNLFLAELEPSALGGDGDIQGGRRIDAVKDYPRATVSHF
jgi:hypothetical protein